MNRSLLLSFSAVLAFGAAGLGQTPKLPPEQLRRGAPLYPNPGLPDEDPMVLVKKFQGLRTTDVLDALQGAGLQTRGFMDHSIRPLWRDNTDKVRHRVYGVAITYQYLPTNKPVAAQIPYADFKKWHGHWYSTYAPEMFTGIIKPGHAIVIDAQGIEDTGFIGSNNAYGWFSRGMTGVVTNGSCRDTDELILEGVPVYSKYQGGGTRPGRIEAGAINVPVVVGGVLVVPGDFIVADGDGVVVVPRAYIDKVLEIAWDIAKHDKDGRRKLYQKMGVAPDETVK